MTVISKTSSPSPFYSCIYEVFPVPVLKQNLGFLKQSRYFGSLHPILNEMVSRISKSVSHANNFQKFNNHNEEFSNLIAAYGILVIAIICNYLQNLHAETVRITVFALLNKFLEALKSLKPYFLQKPLDIEIFVKYLEPICKSPALPMILGLIYTQPQIQTILKDLRCLRISQQIASILGIYCLQQPKMISGDLEHIRKFPGKPEVLDPLYLQMPLDTKLCQKDSEQYKLLETLPSPETEFPSLDSYQHNNLEIRKSPKKLEDLDAFFKEFEFKMKFLAKYSEEVHKMVEAKVSQNRMKCLEMCYLCEEMISKKKFFDERRFGILNKCDCLICYGCLRKIAGTSGVVMGPINCPSCSVKSDIVAANARWIEGKEKLKFFELLQKHGAPQMKSNMQELAFISPNPISVCESETVKVPLSRSLQLDIASANASIGGKEELGSFDLLQIKEALNKKLYREQRRDLPASLNLIGSGTSELVKISLSCSFKLETVTANTGWIEGNEKLESLGLLRKREHREMKLDPTVFIARNDYFSTRVPIMGLVN